MKWILLSLSMIVVSGCAVNQGKTTVSDTNTREVVTIQKEFPPQIWSDHKLLEISEAKCADKGIEILSSLGFNRVVKSPHGAYVYGNYANNRSAIKCTTIADKTLVYVIVAGPKVDVVQKLRNEIMWQL